MGTNEQGVRPDLDAAGARASAATDGEWRFEPEHETDGQAGFVYIDLPEETAGPEAMSVLVEADWATDEDLEFIAHARRDVPALAEVRRLREVADVLAGDLHLVRRVLVTYQDVARGDFWFWQGDGEDHLESLTCPAVIRPEVLAALLAGAGNGTPSSPDTLLLSEMERLQVVVRPMCNGGWTWENEDGETLPHGEPYARHPSFRAAALAGVAYFDLQSPALAGGLPTGGAAPGVIEAHAQLEAAWSRHHPECRFNVGPRTLTCHPECPEWNAELAAEFAEFTAAAAESAPEAP